jgi:hopanoid-associated phosphorylase
MLGILCGLQDEAKIAQRIPDAKIVCAAAVPQKARELAKTLIGQGATRLMSFGVAGALDSSLPVGAIIVGEKVISEKGAWDCDVKWADELLKRLPQAHCCDVWGSEALIARASEKIAIYKSKGCSIVDMESQCAAEIAIAANIPFAVVRIVCDEATHNVPPLVMAAINADGSTNYKNVMKGLLRNPLEAINLVKVGFSMAKALRVLGETADKLK